jgi:hypothetical protein
MAKKETGSVTPGDSPEIVDDLHSTVDDTVEYTDVTGKDDLPADVEDTPAADDQPADEEAPPAKKPDDVPEELKGKSPAELARMYREAQSLIGRQGAELGDLRRTADAYIKANLQAQTKALGKKPAPAEEKAPDDVDFFTNPQDAITKAVANHPAVKELRGAAREFATREIVRQRQETTREFQAAHPDAAEVLGDPAFREWVAKSPVRKALLMRAHRDYDITAANEVFSTWKEMKALRTPKVPAKDSKPVATKKEARVPTGGNATPRTSGGAKGDKIYRRADIIRLMESDPDRYQMMADEITKAYQEGRVR